MHKAQSFWRKQRKKFKVSDVKFLSVADSLSISCCLSRLCFSGFFHLFLACTSLSFESLRFVRKLGPVRWKLFLFRQELPSESFPFRPLVGFFLVADCENHRWAPELLSLSLFDSKDSIRKSLARKNFWWRVFNCASVAATNGQLLFGHVIKWDEINPMLLSGYISNYPLQRALT